MDANSGSAAGIIYRGPVAYHDSTLGYAIAGAWWHPFFRAWLGIGAANLSLGAAAICRFQAPIPQTRRISGLELASPKP